MAPFESHFDQRRKRRLHMKQRLQKQNDNQNADKILSPCDNLSITELRRGHLPDFADSRRRHPEEQAGEHNIDQERRNLPPSRGPVSGDLFPEHRDQQQSDSSPDHRRRKIQFLEQRHMHPQNLSNNQKKTKSAERRHRIHSCNHPFRRVFSPPGELISVVRPCKSAGFPLRGKSPFPESGQYTCFSIRNQ